METNKILEGNKILAEFMGGKLDSPDSKHYYFIERGRYESELFYNSKWDWLMPVVEKILNICQESDEMEKYYIITDAIPEIGSVFSACVKFAEWYKKQ